MAVARVNGTELFYADVGTGAPCLVMHGGLGLDHTYLHPWLDPLGDVLRLIYYDHRGNGRSGRPPVETLTLDQLVADAEALRAHLGLDRIATLGHSFGGFVSLLYALRFPERVSHLLLMTTAPAWDYLAEIAANVVRKGATEEMLMVLASETTPDDADLARTFRMVTPLYFWRFDPETADRLFRHTIYSAAAMARGRDLMRTYNLTHRLGEIAAPTLILAGRDDFITPPSQAQRLHRGIRNSTLITFEHSGHFPHVEEPESFFAAVRRWLGGAA
jgi:proline iminopeptidase